MALAAYGDANDADEELTATVEQILAMPNIMVGQKKAFRNSPLYRRGNRIRRPQDRGRSADGAHLRNLRCGRRGASAP